MKLPNIFKSFTTDQSGAVTVDWVVLTAAVVLLGLVVVTALTPGVSGVESVIMTGLATAAAP